MNPLRADGLPSYGELYRRWDRQQWSATGIDLTTDRRTWQSAGDEGKRAVFRVGRFAGLLHAEAGVADTLAPYIDAAPTTEQRLVLSTQLADEARHLVFVDRVYREVLADAGADITATLARTERWLSPSLRRITEEALPAAAERLRSSSRDLLALVEAVTLYHLLVESCLGMSTLRPAQRGLRRLGGYPGLSAGLFMMLRDEVRHVLFGTRFLADAVGRDASLSGAIRVVVDRWLPDVTAVLECLPGTDGSRTARALDALRRRLDVIGVRPPVQSRAA
jgi:ribonucleoside-diphosphate reductase beta chain